MRDEHYTPFEGKGDGPPAPMLVLRRFCKAGHVAEIRERSVTSFRAIEFIVFIDEQLQESQMFHGARLALYAIELEARCNQFTEGGWVEDPSARAVSKFGHVQ
jgi:hypothetical protein